MYQKKVPLYRTRATKKGMRHITNPAGTKIRNKAESGTLACRHGLPIHSMV